MSNEYPIKTVADFLTIPDESIDACLTDFKEWIRIARQRVSFSADMSELLGVPGAINMSTDDFTWIDDGLVGLHHVDIVDGSDGTSIGRISFEDAK